MENRSSIPRPSQRSELAQFLTKRIEEILSSAIPDEEKHEKIYELLAPQKFLSRPMPPRPMPPRPVQRPEMMHPRNPVGCGLPAIPQKPGSNTNGIIYSTSRYKIQQDVSKASEDAVKIVLDPYGAMDNFMKTQVIEDIPDVVSFLTEDNLDDVRAVIEDIVAIGGQPCIVQERNILSQSLHSLQAKEKKSMVGLVEELLQSFNTLGNNVASKLEILMLYLNSRSNNNEPNTSFQTLQESTILDFKAIPVHLKEIMGVSLLFVINEYKKTCDKKIRCYLPADRYLKCQTLANMCMATDMNMVCCFGFTPHFEQEGYGDIIFSCAKYYDSYF